MSKVVIADYDYDGEDDSQLTFKEGDRIVVLEEDETGWWTGRLEKNGNEGYFPSTYIKSIDEEQEYEEEEEEEYEDVAIADASADMDENTQLQVANDSDDTNNGSSKKLNNKRYKMQKTKSASEQEQESKEIEVANTNGSPLKVKATNSFIKKNKVETKEGEGGTTTTGAESPEIDYNNYFANAQKIVSIPDNFEGEEGGAAMENYYAAEVLNLKFNPNAKTRFGLASHYMSMFSSIATIFLSTSAFSWSNGSPFLKEQKLISSYDACLFVGLYGFFSGIVIFIWEYVRGDIRSDRAFPFRSVVYFIIGFPLFFTLATALAGVFWLNTTIFSFLAWKNGETYERKKKRSYSDEKVLTPKEKILQFFDCNRIKESIKARFVSIRQQSQLKKYLFLALYLTFNFAYILYWAAFYSQMVIDINEAADTGTDGFGDAYTQDELDDMNNKNTNPGDPATILTRWFPMAKMFGNLLDINCAFILFPVCRSFISQLYNISTDQRTTARFCNFFLSFMPLDKALQFHKLCALLVAIGTIFHTWAHFNHFAFVPATYEKAFGATVWLSGSLIIICMQFLYCTSFSAVRHGKFELFWYTHHVFVIFFLSILFHGANSLNPNFWKWFLVPGILYGLERTIRELKARQAVGVVSVLHMNNKNARIFCLELEKTGPIKNHQEGQYVFIKAPIISKAQWHPFTISSPPDQKTLTLHIRNMGDGSWTDRLQQFFQAIAPGKAYAELYHRDGNILVPQTIGPDGNNLICIDGPMAAPTQHLGEYGTSIVIGAGIGLTPVRSTLQSIIYFRFKRGIGQTFPDHAYCVWIVNYKQLDAYRFMCRTLKEAEDELYNMRKKNPKQMENKLLQMHIFVTSFPKTEKEQEKLKFKLKDVENPENDRQRDLALWGTHYDDVVHEQSNLERVTAPFTEIDIWKCLKEPSDQPTQIGDIIIHKGRPKWDMFFQPIQQAHRGNKIGVMFCGPDIIAKDLKKACGKFTDFDTKTVFMLHKENF